MQAPPGSIPIAPLSVSFTKKAGKQVEFTADNFPADFDDATYKFVKRYDKVVRKGNASPAIKDFFLQTFFGQRYNKRIIERRRIPAVPVPEK